jgi:hypothetical protein
MSAFLLIERPAASLMKETAFAMNLSKAREKCVNTTLQASIARQLAAEGVELHAADGVRYVTCDHRSGGSKMAVSFDFPEAEDYDPKRYVRGLAEACASVMKEFDCRYDSQFVVQRHEYGRGLEGPGIREVADPEHGMKTQDQNSLMQSSSIRHLISHLLQ